MTYHRQPRVVSTKLGSSESILLHMDTRQYYALNETGALVWDLLAGGSDVRSIADAFATHFEIPAPSAEAEARDYLELLLAERLVRTADPS